jgi:hypothetical protein
VDEANTNAKYPAAPANFLQDTFYKSSNGRFYHAIMYGKNVMGGYTDKLSYEERWQVIHYIHSLMAKEKKLEYSATANTMTNNDYDRPAAVAKQMAAQAEVSTTTTETPHDGATHQDGAPHKAGEKPKEADKTKGGGH